MFVVDVSEPTDPIVVGLVDTPGFASDVSIANDVALVADGSSVRIVDVANPAQAVEIASIFFGSNV